MADINLGVGGANSATGGYEIANSLKLEADNSETLSKTFSSDGNKQTWTVSFWVKRTELSTDQMVFSAGDTYFYFLTSDVVRINTRGATNYFFDTSAVFRDTSAWYHFVVRVDTTNSTAADRTRLYVNGVEFSSSTTSYENNTGNTGWNDSAKTHVIGNYTSGSYHLCGYLAEFHSIDGQSLEPTDFGEYDEDSGIWKPKAYTGSYGTNGFYLDFENSGSLGADSSGNGNNFTLNNITSADQALDTPTNNFAIINPLTYKSSSDFKITNGGTVFESETNTGYYYAVSTMAVSNGKWYFEADMDSGIWQIGTVNLAHLQTVTPQAGHYLGHNNGGSFEGGFGVRENGTLFRNDNYTTGWAGNAVAGDTVSIAIDMDNSNAYYAINGTWQNSGDPTSGATGTGAIPLSLQSNDAIFFAICKYDPNKDHKANFGGYHVASIDSPESDANGYGTFERSPPSGYYALCTKNLAEYG